MNCYILTTIKFQAAGAVGAGVAATKSGASIGATIGAILPF